MWDFRLFRVVSRTYSCPMSHSMTQSNVYVSSHPSINKFYLCSDLSKKCVAVLTHYKQNKYNYFEHKLRSTAFNQSTDSFCLYLLYSFTWDYHLVLVLTSFSVGSERPCASVSCISLSFASTFFWTQMYDHYLYWFCRSFIHGSEHNIRVPE